MASITNQDTSQKIMNGLPTEGSGYFDVVDQPDDYGEEITPKGTRRLYQNKSHQKSYRKCLC